LAKLLVSVRSPVEARAAVAGGAAIIDVKEPSRGALGRADFSVWRAVREAVPATLPVSVALGEISEWNGSAPVDRASIPWRGIGFVKLGLAGAPPDWFQSWRASQAQISEPTAHAPAWVAVVYVDWERANAPHPDAILGKFLEVDECRVVLFDSWDKSCRTRIVEDWNRRIVHVRKSGRLVALAGSLDEPEIRRLARLEPDYFAVRGAACVNGDRMASIDSERVARLVEAAAGSAR
jgi:(5-formylfuran-3-yl)methyl phosphate synthase